MTDTSRLAPQPTGGRSWPTVLLALGVGLIVAADVASWLQHRAGYPHVVAPWLEASAAGVVYGTVGWFIARRVPGNPLGPIMLTLSVASGVQLTVGALAIASVQEGASVFAQRWSGGLYNAMSSIVVGCLLLIVLIAPTGRPLNRFYRWVAMTVLATSAVAFLAGFGLGTDSSSLSGGPTEGPLPASLAPAVWQVNFAALLVVVTCSLVALVGLGLRYAQTRGDARRQVTWVVGGGLAGILVLWAQGLLSQYLPQQAWVGSLAWVIGPSLLPLGIAVAVLRHGLYELDHVVSRTVSYAIVTAVVVAVYVVLVTGISQLVPGADNLAVAAATLAAAATVRPLLHQVRARVDRRFNRSAFDAELAVHDFGTALRTLVDPDRVVSELSDVLVRTMQPQLLAVWLRRTP